MIHTIKTAILIAATLVLAACQTNAVTGRSQVSIVTDQQVATSANQYYASMVNQAKARRQLVESGPYKARVDAITNRLIEQAVRYYPEAAKWNWQVALIDERREVNAFCMHGGLMGIYSGFFYEVKATDDEIAQVMGHEIAHALAGHSKEKLSTRIATDAAANVGGMILGQVTGAHQMSQQAMAGAGAAFVKLPNSRHLEHEADLVGMEIAARAGYNPDAAISLWKKIGGDTTGKSDFWATHPSSDKRIDELQTLNAPMKRIYNAARKSPKAPFNWIHGDPAARPVITEAMVLKLYNPKTDQHTHADEIEEVIEPAVKPAIKPATKPAARPTKPAQNKTS